MSKEQLTEFVREYCSFLEAHGFVVIDLETSESFGSDAVMVLDGSHMQIKIVKDREEMAFYFLSKSDTRRNNWYDLDIVKNAVAKRDRYVSDNSLRDFTDLYDSDKQQAAAAANAEYIRQNVDKIVALFAVPQFRGSKAALNKLRSQRARVLFG
jgi:hypothetical protein